MRQRHLALLFAIAAGRVDAAPPPPPPKYVYEAMRALVEDAGPSDGVVAALFADDVVAYQNGQMIAGNKSAWLAWRAAARAHYNGRIIGFSESAGGYSDGGGDLLVVDTFDTVDRSDLPPTSIADPRMATRSTLYQFGRDGLIHFIRISRTGGFWATPRSAP